LAAKMHSVAKGKRSELYVMAVLLESGFKVFQPLADTEGIDCIVLGQGNKFYPIQIKSRAEFTKGDLVGVYHFTNDMFIIIYDVLTKKYWIIPSGDYQRLSRPQILKDGTLLYRLAMTKKNSPELEKYEGENSIKVLETECAQQLLNLKGEKNKEARGVLEGLRPSKEIIFPLPLIKGKGDKGGWVDKQSTV